MCMFFVLSKQCYYAMNFIAISLIWSDIKFI